nr:hypothetical protein [Tanacetum cinerariifolium]
MAATRPGNIVARRVTDDLIAFSGETAISKYMKSFLVQQVAETHPIKDQDEVHDSLLAAKDAKRGEESKLLALHEVIVEALEKIERQGNNVEILDVNRPRGIVFEFLLSSFLCYKGVDLHNDMRLCPYGGGVLEMSRLWYVCYCYTDRELFSLMHECVVLEMYDLVYGWQINHCRIWVSITKDRRLIAKLEALGQRVDVLKPLKYMREMVAWDSTRVGVLEQLSPGAYVGMSLKAEYATDMGETM